jgi:hypothetical protein
MARRRADTAIVRARRRGKVDEPPPASAKGAKVERARRVIMVQQLILDGVDDDEILHWLTTEITAVDVDELASRGLTVLPKNWRVSDTTAREYLQAAMASWVRAEAPEKLTQKHVRNRKRIDHLYRLALASGDHSTALKAAIEGARIDGTYEPHAIGGADEDDDVDLDEAVREIDHAAHMLEMGRRRGIIPPAMAAAAIDVEPSEATAGGIEELHPEADEPAPVADPTGIN